MSVTGKRAYDDMSQEVVYFNEGGPAFKKGDELDRDKPTNRLIAVSSNPPLSNKSVQELTDQITQLSTQKDMKGLRNLAYDLFNPPDGIGLAQRAIYRYAPSVHSLIYDIDREFKIEDLEKITTLMIKGLVEFRETYKPRSFHSKESKKEECRKGIVQEGSELFKEKGEEYTGVCHGGGYRHLTDFLAGKTPGYQLEGGGLGIQVGVGPQFNERDTFYAGRAYRNFDTPGILTARIQYKYLEPAPNTYEAGLTSANVKYLEDVKVEKLLR